MIFSFIRNKVNSIDLVFILMGFFSYFILIYKSKMLSQFQIYFICIYIIRWNQKCIQLNKWFYLFSDFSNINSFYRKYQYWLYLSFIYFLEFKRIWYIWNNRSPYHFDFSLQSYWQFAFGAKLNFDISITFLQWKCTTISTISIKLWVFTYSIKCSLFTFNQWIICDNFMVWFIHSNNHFQRRFYYIHIVIQITFIWMVIIH